MEEKNKTKEIVKVIVGLNYSIDSLVTLFLLKKQDYDITAVAIDFAGEESEDLIPPQCHGIKFKKIKEICDRFDVPLFATDVRSLYDADIKNKFIQSRAIGQAYNPCHYCGHIILYTLFQKMLKLNADFIATGHFARIARKSKGSQVSLLHSISLDDDQSHRIVGVKQEVLRKLILPLGDLRKDEVQKIFERIYPKEIDIKPSKERPCQIFKNIEEYGRKNMPHEFLREGDFVLEKEQLMIGSHKGFFNYEVGMNLNKENISFYFSDRKKAEKLKIKSFDFDQSRILCDYSEDDICQYFIKLTKISSDLDRAAPLSVLARLGSRKNLEVGTLFFKGHQFVLFVLEKPNSIVGEEDIITFYSSIGLQKKVLAQGKMVRSISHSLENFDSEKMSLKFKMNSYFKF